jgi:PAS domain S-box-containing protein
MPSKWDYAIMKIAHVAGIAIERSYSKKALNEYQNKLTALLIEKTKEVEGGEQKFQSYFDLPLVGFAITSPEKGWLDVNQYLCNMLGYSLEELKQMTWLDITHPEDFEAETYQFSRMLAGEIETYSLEQRFIRKNRTTIHTLLSVACLRSENAKVKTVFAVMQDISARKRAEEQLQESQSLVIHSDKLLSLGKLVGSVAHEFNNPLFGLINLVDQLGEKLNKDERKKYSEIAQKECWRMADMIKNLQSFYKPSEGVFIPTEMDKLIEGILLIVAKACEIKGIQVNENYNTDIFTFESIEDQIKQVILNVLQNSIDSISLDGGKITLTLDRTNSDLILKIQDTGKGIKTEDLKLIFDPFFTTKGKEGTGLGLSVSYGIVKSHGGEIIIESVLGVGSAVTLTLPIAREI